MKNGRWYSYALFALLAALSLVPIAASAQTAAPAAGASPGAKAFSQAELDQMVAPIALYPDALLAQVLMASTYPLEVVSATRWVQANPKLTGNALEDAVQKHSWDPAVKSLCGFPSVLQMMNDKLERTQQLGDAFLAQRSAVMASVQGLRRKAADAGHLKTSAEQKIVVEPDVIVIQPATTTVYVPVYNPTVVYGPWWHPAYPPYVWYPPGHVARVGIGFATGVVVGAALWGGCNWRGNDVTININQYNRYNRTNITRTSWEHDAVHRKGVAYRDPTVAQKYRRESAVDGARRDVSGSPATQKRTESDARNSGRPAAREVDRPDAGTTERSGPRGRAAPDGDGHDRPGRGGGERR